MDNTSYLKTLCQKLISGELSDEELRWLQEYFNTGNPEELSRLVRSQLSLPDHNEVPAVSEADTLRNIYSRIEMEMEPAMPVEEKPAVKRLWLKIAAAAMIAFAVTAGWHFFGNESFERQMANDIAPGRNTATLTLANKKKIVLSDVEDGRVASESGVVITKSADHQLVYEIKDAGGADPDKMNTLSTARGETYQVRLPDGTLVALNAASSITYAASLNALEERRVVLTGEAYFEVAPDKTRPFIVESGKQTIEVLGTHFNIQAYEDERVTRTTLLEGTVKVLAKEGSKILEPGQQAVLFDNGNKIQVNKVETEDAVAWKNGYFMFNNENLGRIMTRIGRWYNVEVEYEDAALIKETFFGTVSRYENISKVLRLLEATDAATFKISGNKVAILKSKEETGNQSP